MAGLVNVQNTWIAFDGREFHLTEEPQWKFHGFCLHRILGDTQENAFGQQRMIDYKQQQKHRLIYIYIYNYLYI